MTTRPGPRPSSAARRAAQRRARRRRQVLTRAGVIAAVVILAGVIALVAFGGGGGSHAAAGPEGIPLETGSPLAASTGPGTGATVDGVQCQASEQVAYHVHAHLAVYVNGVLRQLPAGIGVVDPAITSSSKGPFAQATRCYYWLHTHSTDGVIHIESPTDQTYTLGQFFDVWQQPVSATGVATASGAVTAYVNGTKYTGDPASIPLTAHAAIQLDIGTPTVAPKAVDWSASSL